MESAQHFEASTEVDIGNEQNNNAERFKVGNKRILPRYLQGLSVFQNVLLHICDS